MTTPQHTAKEAAWSERWERWKWAVLTFLRHPDTYAFKHRNHYDDLIPGLPLPLEIRRPADKEAHRLVIEDMWERRNAMIAEYERAQAEKRTRSGAKAAAASRGGST